MTGGRQESVRERVAAPAEGGPVADATASDWSTRVCVPESDERHAVEDDLARLEAGDHVDVH